MIQRVLHERLLHARVTFVAPEHGAEGAVRARSGQRRQDRHVLAAAGATGEDRHRLAAAVPKATRLRSQIERPIEVDAPLRERAHIALIGAQQGFDWIELQFDGRDHTHHDD